MNSDKTIQTNDKDIMYINRYTNNIYTKGQILDLNISKRNKDELPDETIFNLYARLLTRSEDQRVVFYHLTYDKAEYTIPKLLKYLSTKYNKSERTYRRAIEYLLKTRILRVYNGIIEIRIEYNLSLLDLDNIKGLMIHII